MQKKQSLKDRKKRFAPDDACQSADRPDGGRVFVAPPAHKISRHLRKTILRGLRV